MLNQIISSLKTTRIVEDGDLTDNDLPIVPKATALIIELRRMEFKMSKFSIIQCFGLMATSVFLFLYQDGKPPFYCVLLLISPLFTIWGERWEWHKARQKLVIELLAELVSENNRLRRSLPPASTRLEN